ncbi:hypothetical protein [Anaerophilus nitritogenes]|uniref:hypothetical protein n=1 Tax=Anaerophilus nitritogenes TaxID=2498136 RepID=UPI00101D7C8A|nr:hypothetical protein [Anaerophilus nitritogenes]
MRGNKNNDNGVNLRADINGLGSPEGENYYIKVAKTKITKGDVGLSVDGHIVNGQINNIGRENANIDLSGSYGRAYGGAVFDKQEGVSGELSLSGYAAIVEGQANIDLKGKNTQTTIGLAPSGGSIGGHLKAGVNYIDENNVYHYVNVEVGGAFGIGVIAKIDITNQGHGQDSD